MTTEILIGDCRAVLATMASESVDCVVTSPPYWGLRSYLPDDHPDKHLEIGSEPTVEEWVETMVAVFREVHRVLRAKGTLWLNLGDSYAGSRSGPDTGSTLEGSRRNQNEAKRAKQAMTASRRRDDKQIPRSDLRMAGFKAKDLVGQPWRVAFALQADGWWLRQAIIWDKPDCMPESVTDRCTNSYEHVFLLAKSPSYYFNADAIAERVADITVSRLAQDVESQAGSVRGNGGKKSKPMKAVGNGVTRNARSVWRIPTARFRGLHFATFPPELARRCLLAGCPPGGTVLDPFFGSGTVGLEADRLQMHAVLIDLDRRNAPMARDRVEGDGALFAEVRE